MANLSDFLPAAGGGGGGGIPKYEEFTSSGTFTPTQALIDAGGKVSLFMVGAGASGYNGGSWYKGGEGGEVIFVFNTLTNTNSITITIGSGSANSAGGNTIFTGSTAGGTDITAYGGSYSTNRSVWTNNRLTSGYPGIYNGIDYNHGAGSGTFGYGAGGAGYYEPGVYNPKPNSGQGGQYSNNAGASGFVRITWFE